MGATSKHTSYLIPFLLVCVLLAGPRLKAQESSNSTARDQLQKLIAQLQQSPGDQALRERIIALALTLNTRPATPDAVTMAEGAAEYAFKNAKAASDFSDAAKQYEKALLLAPWLAADYFNCGVAYEKAGDYTEAIRGFTLYLLASPNADDAQAVKKRIGGLQYAEQKAEDEANSPAAKLERFFRSLDGGVWRCDHGAVFESNGANKWIDDERSYDACGHTYLAISGHTVSYSSYYRPIVGGDGVTRDWYRKVPYDPNAKPDWTATLTSYRFAGPPNTKNGVRSYSNEFVLSQDGRTINEESRLEADNGVVHGYKAVFVRFK